MSLYVTSEKEPSTLTKQVSVTHAARSYLAGPSQYGGDCIVQVLSDGARRPVRNSRERAAVLAKALLADVRS